jgi:hypothetical protein
VTVPSVTRRADKGATVARGDSQALFWGGLERAKAFAEPPASVRICLSTLLSDPQLTMPTEQAKKFFTPTRIAALILAAGCVSLLLLWLIPPAAPSLVLPNPNGYDDFQKAIAVYQGPTPDVSNADLEDLRTHVERNREALQWVRAGLGHQCRLPVQYTELYRDRMMQELAGLKGLAQLLKAEGKVAEEDNRLGEAVNSYLETIRFGQESVRGGLLIHKLVGLACEAIGLQPLEQLQTRLSAQDCKKVVKTLEAIDRNRESVESILADEKAWGRRIGGGWRYFLTYRMLKPAHQKFEQKHKTTEARRRRLLVDAAVRWYQLENVSPSKSLSELVPRYLSAVPEDPLTGKPFAQ